MRNTLIRRTPLRLGRENRGLDHLFGSLLDWTGDETLAHAWAPAIDIEETKKATVIRADLPGLDPKDIKISVNEGHLLLEGERADTREGKEGQARWVERFSGAFHRTVALLTPVDAAKIKASYKNGVLEITCPVKAEALPRRIDVSVN